MEEKSALNIYIVGIKTEIKEERLYDNTLKSKLMFRCRTNSL